MSENGRKTLRTFDEVLHDVIFNSRSKTNAKSIAEDTKIPYWRLSNWANVEQDEHNLPGKHIARITNASGDTSLVEHLCIEVGGVFIPLQDNHEIQIGNAKDGILEILSELGLLGTEFTKATEDDSINKTEGASMEAILSRIAHRSVALTQLIAILVKG